MIDLESGKHTFDVLKYAKKIERKYPELIKTVKDFIHSTSQKQDLIDAKAVIESAVNYSRSFLPIEGSGEIDLEKSKLLRASFTEAVLLYSRATDHNGTRGKFDTSALSAEMGEFHREVRKIRDKVLAHYVGKEPLQSGPWFIDEVIGTIKIEGDRIGFAVTEGNHRQSWKGDVLEKMPSVVDKLIDAVDIKIEKLRTSIIDTISETYRVEQCRAVLADLSEIDREMSPGSVSYFKSYSDK